MENLYDFDGEDLSGLAEMLEESEEVEISFQCLECCSVFTGSADQLTGADGCPNCGSEDLELV